MGAALEPRSSCNEQSNIADSKIQTDLLSTSTDMFGVWFRIEGTIKPPGAAPLGERIKIRSGPFSRRWAYLIAEIAGQAAIDVVLGPTE